VKAISDEADFAMPLMGQLLTPGGEFQSWPSSRYGPALRPGNGQGLWHWARNSKRATESLWNWLQKDLASGLPPKEIVTLDRAEFSEVKH